MRAQIFASGLIMLGMGVLAMCGLGGISAFQLEKTIAMEMLQGSLLVGGGLIICGLFSLQMRWHGIAGAGVIGLLGAGRGIANLPGFLRWLTGDQSRGMAPVIELVFTILCVALMIRVMKALQRERTRRLLEEEPGQDSV